MENLLKQPPIQQPIKGEIGMRVTSDDNVMIKQIMATHAPDGREIDVKPILHIVEDILSSAAPVTQATSDAKIEVSTEDLNAISSLEAVAYTINRLSSEMSYKCVGGIDGHSTAVFLFNMLSSYPWQAKMVLALAAFALNYGDFWLLTQIYSTNRFAKKMAILKQLPGMLENVAVLKPRFDALQDLIKSFLGLTKCIVVITDLPSGYISPDNPAYSATVLHIPVAIYWIFRSIICSTTYITNLTGMGHEFYLSTTETWELSSLTHKINNINNHLQRQLSICNKQIEEKRELEAYDSLLHLFEMIHIDNMRTLRALIYAKDDILPLVDGPTKRRARTLLSLIYNLFMNPF